MKKNIFIALVAFVFTSLSAFAQSEKEYSMVIALQNGTTVTLGHNDVKNITFTGDNVAAEGNVVNSIEELQKAVQIVNAETKANLESLEARVAAGETQMAAGEAQMADNRNMIEAVHQEALNQSEELQARLKYVEVTAEEKTEQAKQELQDRLEMTKADLLKEIMDLKYAVDNLQKQIEELKAGK